MAKKKVLFMITKSSWGGAGTYVYDLATGLPHDRYEAVVALGGSGQLKERLEEAGIRVVPIQSLQRDIGILKEIRVFLKTLSLFRKERPDVVHVNSSKAGGLGCFAARLVGVQRIIFTSHGWAFNEKRAWIERVVIYFFHWLTVMLSHKTIANSEATKHDIAFLPFMKSRIIVITLSIIPETILSREEARETLGIPNDVFCIGTGTELHSNKGIDITLEAFAKTYGVTLAIIGDGDEHDKLRTLARGLDVSDRVQFLGVVPNARAYMSAFDIFVLASRTESFGYILLEAGLAELPVVATRVGGIPEIIDNEKSGLLVPPEEPEALAHAIQSLTENEEKRKQLGTTLKDKVLTRFSFERMLEKTLSVYEY